MNGAITMADAPGRTLPGLQATMAELVAQGAVSYDPSRAQWFEVVDGERGEARRARGRTLRELRRAGLIEVAEGLAADEFGCYPVELTEEGKARHRSQPAATSG